MREPKRQVGPIEDVPVVLELCMNLRNCLRIARGAFMTDPKTGKTRAARWQQIDPDDLWKAGRSCPSGAIRFRTAEGWVVPRWDEVAHWESARHRAARARSDQPLDKSKRPAWAPPPSYPMTMALGAASSAATAHRV